MPKFLAIALATCVLSSGTLVHAQRIAVPDPRLDPKNRTLDKITTYEEMNDCQMKPNVEAAKALLASTTLEEAKRHAARFRWQACTLRGPNGDFMKVEPNDPKLDELRWMSAEYFLRREPASTAALHPLPRQRVYERPWFAASSRDNSIDEMAACVADTNPAGILALNKTIVGSAEEQTALASLKDDFIACLRAGVQLTGERKPIRGALIEALYQRTQSWSAASTETSGAVR